MDITVIITALNERQYISEAIQSVLEQNRLPNEILVIDAGSSDGTKSIIQSYSNYNDIVKPVYLEESVNIPEMRNIGLKKAQGDFITFLDGDDRFRQEKLSKEIETIRSHPDAKVAFSNVAYVDEGANLVELWNKSGEPPTGDVLYETLMRDWPKNSLYRDELISSDLVSKIGEYDEELTILEDWDYKIRIAAETKVAYCPEVLTEYRQHDQGISSISSYRLVASATKRIYENRREIIQKQLKKSEQENVEEFMKSRINKFEALASMEDGSYTRATHQYLNFLKQNPTHLMNYKLHLRFFLPSDMYDYIRGIYRRTF